MAFDPVVDTLKFRDTTTMTTASAGGSLVGAAYTCTAQNITSSTSCTARMDLTVEVFDTDTFLHATDLWKLVVPTGLGGVYLIQANAEIVAHATGFRQIVITDGDGNELIGTSGSSRGGVLTTLIAVSTVKVLAQAAVISFWVGQNSGTTKDALASSGLSLIRLGDTPA